MELETEPCNYVTLNTHLSLYQYTRLPFGIASASAIFHKDQWMLYCREFYQQYVILTIRCMVTWAGIRSKTFTKFTASHLLSERTRS